MMPYKKTSQIFPTLCTASYRELGRRPGNKATNLYLNDLYNVFTSYKLRRETKCQVHARMQLLYFTASLLLFAGDIVILESIVSEGWMTGRVQRTGKHGMLPSNYVEKI